MVITVGRRFLTLSYSMAFRPPASGRLIDTGGRAKGDRITHRIAITSIADVDSEVKGWLKIAYDLDA